MVVTDGSYYQAYSYEIVIDELFDVYKGVLKKLLHPAGYAAWGVYDLKKVISIQANAIKQEVERNSSFFDAVYYVENFIWSISKSFTDDITSSDSKSIYVQQGAIAESITSSDSKSISVRPATVTDAVAPSDVSTVYVIPAIIAELVATSDTRIFDYYKYITDILDTPVEIFTIDSPGRHEDVLLPQTETLILSTTKALSDIQLTEDSVIIFDTSPGSILDSVVATDYLSIDKGLFYSDSIISPTDIMKFIINLSTILESATPTDSISIATSPAKIQETLSASESFVFSGAKSLNDNISGMMYAANDAYCTTDYTSEDYVYIPELLCDFVKYPITDAVTPAETFTYVFD